MKYSQELEAEMESVRTETERRLIRHGRLTLEEIIESLSSDEGKAYIRGLAERLLQKRSMKLHH